MKKIIFFLLIPLMSLGQIKVRDLPTTTGGVGGDWLIKNDQAASPSGTKKISVDNFIATYSIQNAPTTTCTTQSLNDSTTKLSNTIFVDRAVSLRVPYTGATSDLDMGSYNINANAIHIKGTGTTGHLGLRRQTGTPSASANESSLFANTNGDIGWKNDSNYLTTFKSSSNTADRIYTFQNKSYTVGDSADIALKANIASPTFTGTLTAPVITATAITTASLTLSELPQNDNALTNILVLASDGTVKYRETSSIVSNGLFGISDSNGGYTYYSTLVAAMAAASSGNTIEQFGNVTVSTSSTIQWKTGVNLNGNGYTYTYTHNSQPFQDNNTAPTVYISNWTLNVTTFTGYAMDSRGNTFGDNFYINSTLGSAYNQESTGQIRGLTATGVDNVIAVANAAYYCNATATNAATGAFIGVGSKYYCTAIISGGLYGISSGASYFCTVIGRATSQNFNNSTCYNCTSINAGARAYSSCSTYNCTASGGSDNYTSCPNVVNCTGISADNCTFIDGCSFYPTSIVGITRGTTIKNTSVYSTWNSASGHAITIDKTTTIVNCDLRVANTSANCISAASALNCSYTDNMFSGATTSVNANVTQTNANTQDSQGNINY